MKFKWKQILLFGSLAIAVLVSILLVNTFRMQSNQTAFVTRSAPELTNASILHFQQAIRIKTVSYGDRSKLDPAEFLAFQHFLKNTYPLFYSHLQKVALDDYSMLYKWEGKNTAAKSIVLMAHQDVVPVEESTRSLWSVEPFGGEIKNDSIWGRGATDDKLNLVSIVESAEKLLKEGFKPARTIYFAFGDDEEVGGLGAKAVVSYLKSQNIEAELVLDEGGMVTKEKVPGMKRPVALVGTSEKGYLSLELSVEKPGGHSSMPEKETAIDILSRAIVKLKDHPFQANLTGPVLGLIDSLGPEMSFFQRMAFANLWLFKPLVISVYEKTPSGGAMIRTTLAPTLFHSGFKDNVVPTLAKATLNLRLLPGDRASEVASKVKQMIGDARVRVDLLSTVVAEASSVTTMNGYAYKKVDEIIKKTFANTATSPFLMIGASDSRHFADVSNGIIKFSPMIDPIGFHGIDERVSLESYRLAQWFYEQLMRELD